MQKKKGRQILAVIMATMMAAQSANAASGYRIMLAGGGRIMIIRIQSTNGGK